MHDLAAAWYWQFIILIVSIRVYLISLLITETENLFYSILASQCVQAKRVRHKTCRNGSKSQKQNDKHCRGSCYHNAAPKTQTRLAASPNPLLPPKAHLQASAQSSLHFHQIHLQTRKILATFLSKKRAEKKKSETKS